MRDPTVPDDRSPLSGRESSENAFEFGIKLFASHKSSGFYFIYFFVFISPKNNANPWVCWLFFFLLFYSVKTGEEKIKNTSEHHRRGLIDRPSKRGRKCRLFKSKKIPPGVRVAVFRVRDERDKWSLSKGGFSFANRLLWTFDVHSTRTNYWPASMSVNKLRSKTLLYPKNRWFSFFYGNRNIQTAH